MHCKIHSGFPKSYQNKIAISLSTAIIGITENYRHLQKIHSQNTVVMAQNETRNLKAHGQ